MTRTGASMLLCVAASLTTAGASATTALFFPRGSSAHVERHHVAVSLTATGAITWDAIDIAGDATGVGALVAVKAGGRVEVTARAWVDVVEEASSVRVSTVPAGSCKAIGAVPAIPSVTADGGINVSANGKVKASAESSSGCNGESGGSVRADGGSTGGCFSNSSSPSGGCGSCESCEPGEPGEHGHPGCSAFMNTTGCGPLDPSTSAGSSSGSSGGISDGGSTPRIGPYEVLKVGAADGSAARWLAAHDYEPGASFDEGAAGLERAGYELFAVRALPPAAASVIQSLRVVTTSATATLPLRLLRMGSSVSSITPLTLLVLASTPQKLVGSSLIRIDESALTWTGSTSNYESLVTAALGLPLTQDAGAPSDGGPTVDSGISDGGIAPAARWLFESARSVANRATPRKNEAGTSNAPTLADDFLSRCGDRTAEKHAVCTQFGDAGELDTDDAGDAAAEPAPPDGGAIDDAGASDAAASDAAASASPGPTACPDISRERCDDIDLAIAGNGSVIVTRFRGAIGGSATDLADLVFATSTDPLTEGRFTIRANGQPGLCEPAEVSGSVSGSASVDESAEAATCRQTTTRTRSNTGWNLGPLVMLVVAIGAVSAIMRRARR